MSFDKTLMFRKMSQSTFKLQANRNVLTKQRRYRYLIFRGDVENEMQICMNIYTRKTNDVTKTGNGERGTGNGSLGTSSQR